jgi:hypothetical protein
MTRTRAAWGWFIGWLVVGAGAALGTISILSIGVFVLAITVVIALLFATRRSSVDGLPGLISGFSLPLFYVAYLNRGGPGQVCNVHKGVHECSERWDPRPFVVVGAIFLFGGLAAFVVVRHFLQRRALQSASRV